MEIRGVIHRKNRVVGIGLCLLLLMGGFYPKASAQPPWKACTVKDGKMYIMLSKQLGDPALDSFILQYDLADLKLKEFLRKGFRDSLMKQGWNIEQGTTEGFILSRPLSGINYFKNPEDRIIYSQRHTAEAGTGAREDYGYNRFRNKYPFAVNDSIVTFYLRGHTNAKQVMLAGSFNDWVPDALTMTRTDSGWTARVKLGPGKYWYKFITDGNWITDQDNRLNENDGKGNINSVFYKTNFVFRLSGHSSAKKVYLSGSFNNWAPDQSLMNRTTEGWELPVYLAEGTHTYRYVADGEWFADPVNPEKYPNEFGEYNSVVRLGKSHLFQLEGYLDAGLVALSGSFNGWRQDELFMRKTDKGWELPYTLGPGNYEFNFIVDKTKEVKPVAGSGANFTFVIAPNYSFRVKGFAGAKTVCLAGDFNNWSPNSFMMKREGDEWVLAVHLSMGKHLYKFIVDAQWILDPANKLWEKNEFGTGNSVIWIDR